MFKIGTKLVNMKLMLIWN